jgi:hypothetical protein
MENNGRRRPENRDLGKETSHRTDAAELIRRVEGVLCDHPLLHGYMGRLFFEVEDRTLTLRGRLPTFYLKQVLQTTLRNLPGVSTVENRVEVVAPRGLGQVKSRSWEFT